MQMRCAVLVIAGILGCLAAPAHADPRADIAAKAKAAMASYDAMDYEAARKLLNQALAIAKRSKLDGDPLVARVYVDLGITQLAGSDTEAAKVSFLSAAQIDPKITIDAAYKSPDVVKLLDEAKAAAGDGASRGGDARTPGDTDETEDPLDDKRGASAGVSAGAVAQRGSRILIAAAGGTSLGYVTGSTETGNQVQKCCIGTSPVVVAAEVGYRASPQLSFGLAARIGFPIGANVMNHATSAIAGFARVRYALSSSGDGLRVMGEIGAGILRNTIKLDNMAPGMNTDIVAQGPLLIGAGIGFMRHISRSIAFHIDLDVITAAAVATRLGSANRLNSGISADMSVGLAFGF
jgi:Tetratricopeptide repeat